MTATDGKNQISGRQRGCNHRRHYYTTIMKMLIDYIKVMGKHEIEFEFKCSLAAKESL